MKDTGFWAGLVILFVAFLAGAFVGWRAGHVLWLPSQECVTGRFAVVAPYGSGLVEIGETQLCGYSLEFKGIYGPSVEEFKKAAK